MVTYVVVPDPSEVGVTTTSVADDELGNTDNGVAKVTGGAVVTICVTIGGNVSEELEVIEVDVKLEKLEVELSLGELPSVNREGVAKGEKDAVTVTGLGFEKNVLAIAI